MPKLTTKQRLMKGKAQKPSEAESVALETTSDVAKADIKSLTPLGEKALLERAGLDGRVWRVGCVEHDTGGDVAVRRRRTC